VYWKSPLSQYLKKIEFQYPRITSLEFGRFSCFDDVMVVCSKRYD